MKRGSTLICIVALMTLFLVACQAPTNTPAPTANPTATTAPTIAPTATPTVAPTTAPTVAPTAEPTATPTVAPTATPTRHPTPTPTHAPTPTVTPTPVPTVIDGITAAKLDAIAAETNLVHWDIPWGPTATSSFFDFAGTTPNATPIWRGGKTDLSAFADAGWGLILNAFETVNDQIPGNFIYNKTHLSADAKTLQIIARCNTGDPALSLMGAFRVRAVYKDGGSYVVSTVDVQFTPGQLAQADAAFTQTAEGWVTYDAPPTIDANDAFFFDISAYAGKDVVFFIETNDRMDTKGPGATNLADRVIVLAVRVFDDPFVTDGIRTSELDAIATETNLSRWDIPWAPTATTSFFDFAGTTAKTTPIWRGGKTALSAFADAGWGLILNAFETADDQTPGNFIYNKTDLGVDAKRLQIIARCNTGDPALSEQGAFRVKAAYKDGTGYHVSTLTVNFTDAQKAQTAAAFTQTAEGWVTFAVPPTPDTCDAFYFDISGLADKTGVVFFIEANDRMDTKGAGGANLADRVIILAVRVQNDPTILDGIMASQLDAIAKETNLVHWDIPWGPTATSSFFDFAGTAPSATPIWRGGKTALSAFADAGWGLIMNAFESVFDQTPATFIYNKADVGATINRLQIIARCNTGDPALSLRGAFRVKAVYKEGGAYTVTTLNVLLSAPQLAQADAAMAQTAEGWVTFDAPPTPDVCDAFWFDTTALAGKNDVTFFIETNDRMDTLGAGGTNLADRVIVLAVRLLSIT